MRRSLVPILLTLSACRNAPAPVDGLEVAVSIAPEAYLVEGIAGDAARVTIVVPPGADPHSYEPTPATMEAVADAGLYLAIGMPFEDQWLPRLRGSSPGLEVVRIDSGIDRTANPDPHLWMSPSLMRILASNTCMALTAASPGDSALFAGGLARLTAEIDSVNAEAGRMLEGMRGASFTALHPAYSHFARDYGLVQIALEVEGSEPSPAELASIVQAVRASGSRVVIVSPGFSTGAAGALEMELGIPAAPHDQLSRDWPGSMLDLARIISGGGGSQ